MRFLGNRIRTMLLYRQRLTVKSFALPANVRIVQLKATDTDKLSEVNPNLNVELEERKFRDGHSCHLAIVDDRPAAYGWVQPQGSRTVEDLGCKVHLPQGHIWLYAEHTAEWARGNRLQGLLQRARLNHFAAQGYTTAWILVNADNIASRRTIERVEFELERKLSALVVRHMVMPLFRLRLSDS